MVSGGNREQESRTKEDERPETKVEGRRGTKDEGRPRSQTPPSTRADPTGSSAGRGPPTAESGSPRTDASLRGLPNAPARPPLRRILRRVAIPTRLVRD